MIRVVLDTGVLASALIASRGTIGEVLRLLRNDKFVAIYSKPMLIELVEVLHRPKIQEKYHIRSQEISALIGLIVLRGFPVVTTTTILACRDPKDNKFLEAALDGQADYLITGDDDLLVLNPFGGLGILTPLQFVGLF